MKKKTLKKPTKQQALKFIRYVVIILIANLLIAAGPAFFIIPGGFAMGGTAGIGIFVRSILPESLAWREWAVSITVYVINITLFIIDRKSVV